MAIALVAVTSGACGGDHAAPRVASPFDPPTTTDWLADPAGRDPDRSTGPSRRNPVDEADDTDRADAGGTVPAAADTAGTVASTAVPSTATDPSTWAAFDEALSRRLLGSGDFAAGVAVAMHGEIIHTASYGHRVPPPLPVVAPADSPDAAAPTSATTSTTSPAAPPEPIEAGDRFRIASISKVITAIVVLQLVEAGQLGLDDPVGTRLAGLAGAAVADPNVASITVRQLLAHTSGLPTYEAVFFRGRVDSCPAAAQYGLSRGLHSPPGTQYVYSNLNYCLLGLLVEDIAGRPYDAVVADRLLTPLGISGMRLATTYDQDPAQVVHPSAPFRNYMEVLGAAGSWVATPSDVVTILASLDVTNPGFHPLSDGLVQLMRTPVVTATRPDPTRGYGLGLMAFGGGSFGHTGTVESTHAMVVDRPDGVTWAVLVSGEYPGNTRDLAGIFDDAAAEAGVTFS